MKTVLVTGASGFIASHVILELLRRGYAVRGTLRSMAKAERLIDLYYKLDCDVSKLSFVELDLESDEGWADAMQNVDVVQHLASPFPMDDPKDPMDLVRPAREGALRALRFARQAGIAKVVLTSSTIAISNNQTKPHNYNFTEADWTRTEGGEIRGYALSKTLAEQAAWQDVEKHGGPELAVINPTFVVGPALDGQLGTSALLIKQMFDGAFPAVPEICFGIVDVRDVATAHVNAMERDEANGKRFIASGGTLMMIDIVKSLKGSFPNKSGKLPKFQAPKLLVRFLSIFQSRLKIILPDVGKVYQLDNSQAKELLKMEFRTPDEALKALGYSLIEHQLI